MDEVVRSIREQVAEIGDLLGELVASIDRMDTPTLEVDASCRIDDRLRAFVVGLESVSNSAEAAQASAMSAMGREARALDRVEPVQDTWLRRSHEEFVPDELAALLACTTVAAGARYDTACRVGDVPVVHDAWRTGAIDGRKASLICEQLAYLDNDARDRVAPDAVAYASTHTGPQLRGWLRRRVIASDPTGAEDRRRRALADRRVVVTPRDDGVSELWALLPSVQARQIQQVLTSMATALGSDDARTMDQRRVDVAVDLLLGRAIPPSVEVRVVVPQGALTGHVTTPADVCGLGPVTGAELRELLGAGTMADDGTTWRRLLSDPATGTLSDIAEKRYRPSATLERAVRARDLTCRFPGCRRSAESSGTDLDHTVPYPTGGTAAANLAVLCRRHHRLKHEAGWQVELAPGGAMTWTTPSGRTLETRPWQYTDPPPDDG